MQELEYITEEERIYGKNSEQKILAEIDFVKIEKNTYNIYHTYVSEELRGQGIANKLVQKAYEEITQNRKAKIIATCSYAKKWLEKNEREK